MNIGAIQNSQQNFSSLKIRVKDNGDKDRKEQIEALKSELPEIQQMPEVDKYAISIVGLGGDEINSYLLVNAKRPGLFKTKTAAIEWCDTKQGTIQDAIKKAIDYLHEKESRKDNGINFSC